MRDRREREKQRVRERRLEQDKNIEPETCRYSQTIRGSAIEMLKVSFHKKIKFCYLNLLTDFRVKP